MSTRLYWLSQAIVVEWRLTNATTGNPSDATVAGTITQPGGALAAATIIHPGETGLYLATFDPAIAGKHAYRLTATGAVDSATEGYFYVAASLAAFEPIETDPTTDVGMVRLLIADLDEVDPFFTDAQVLSLITLEGSPRLAAAQALDIIASSEALVSKKIKTQDLQTDGPAVAAELRARAKTLRDQAAEGLGAGDDGILTIVDFVPYPVTVSES